MNPVRAIRVEDVAGHVGMGGLSHGQSAAAIAAQRIADDTGCGRAYYVDAVAVVVLDDVRLGEFVVRPQTPMCTEALPSTRTPFWRLRRMVLFTTRAKLF